MSLENLSAFIDHVENVSRSQAVTQIVSQMQTWLAAEPRIKINFVLAENVLSDVSIALTLPRQTCLITAQIYNNTLRLCRGPFRYDIQLDDEIWMISGPRPAIRGACLSVKPRCEQLTADTLAAALEDLFRDLKSWVV